MRVRVYLGVACAMKSRQHRPPSANTPDRNGAQLLDSTEEAFAKLRQERTAGARDR